MKKAAIILLVMWAGSVSYQFLFKDSINYIDLLNIIYWSTITTVVLGLSGCIKNETKNNSTE